MNNATTLAPAPSTTASPDELFGHPKGLYICFFTEMWERFSFYGMKALLALYLIKHHGFSDAESLSVLGAYGGLVYATPVLGGILADRYLGMRKAVVLGGVLLCLGHLGMAVEGHAATIGPDGVVHRDLFALSVFYLSLALIISGVGFLKPNISTVVGKLYPEDDPRLDSGFTLFYAGINVGALFSALICGYLGDRFGWGYGFGAAGIGMLAGLSVFLTGQKYLQGHAEPPNPEALRRRLIGPLNVEWTIYLCAALALPALWALMQLGSAVLWLQLLTMAAWLGWLGWYVTVRCTPVQRQQMLACVFFVAICLLFFALYEQTYGSWVLFNDRMLTKDLFPSLVIREGHPVPWSVLPLILSPFMVALALRMRGSRAPAVMLGSLTVLGMALIVRDCIVLPQSASSLTYLGALFIVLLSPIMAWLWPFLERYGMNPSKPVKSAIGLAFAGLAFLPLMAGNHAVGPDSLGSVWWIVLGYFLIEIGEVTLSPIGLAAVTQLSVPQVVGLMMGAWWLGTSFSEQLASIFGKFAALDIPADGKIDMAVATAKYGELFQHMVWLGLGSAAVALLLTPVVRRWMHGVK
ncbi:peptide MFS transporter [Dyella subtropica]|uniref:peptide MFS transporter n=1 Tax=Dyella subtropica TaxID=2992127 RepID=UPI00225BD8A1|nr:oligopeptide:H+ symporter [Dyella subtropica]